jgi:hypothetical protein
MDADAFRRVNDAHGLRAHAALYRVKRGGRDAVAAT